MGRACTRCGMLSMTHLYNAVDQITTAIVIWAVIFVVVVCMCVDVYKHRRERIQRRSQLLRVRISKSCQTTKMFNVTTLNTSVYQQTLLRFSQCFSLLTNYWQCILHCLDHMHPMSDYATISTRSIHSEHITYVQQDCLIKDTLLAQHHHTHVLETRNSTTKSQRRRRRKAKTQQYLRESAIVSTKSETLPLQMNERLDDPVMIPDVSCTTTQHLNILHSLDVVSVSINLSETWSDSNSFPVTVIITLIRTSTDNANCTTLHVREEEEEPEHRLCIKPTRPTLNIDVAPSPQPLTPLPNALTSSTNISNTATLLDSPSTVTPPVTVQCLGSSSNYTVSSSLSLSSQSITHQPATAVRNKAFIIPQPAPKNNRQHHCFAVLRELRTVVESWITSCEKRLRPHTSSSVACDTTVSSHVEWSGERLCPFGSLRLGAWSDSSDVDLLVLGPPWLHREHFFERSRTSCGFIPFLQQFLKYRDRLVRNIVFLPNAHVPVIRLMFADIAIDMLYCQTPMLHVNNLSSTSSCILSTASTASTLPSASVQPRYTGAIAINPLPISSTWGGARTLCLPASMTTVGTRREYLTLETCEQWLLHLDAKSAISLSGWRVTETILHLLYQLDPQCLTAYCQTLSLIKRWAQERGLYGQNFGFLGGISWALLLLAVMQQTTTPKRDVTGIWCAFLKQYRTWNWASQAVDVFARDSTTSATAFQSAMTIRTPLDQLHSMNAAFHVNSHTLAVLCENIERAAYDVFNDTHVRTVSLNTFLNVTASTVSTARYFRTFSHYITVSLAACDHVRLNLWRGWIESQLRGLLQWMVHKTYIHASAPWPEWIPLAAVPIHIDTHSCSLWPRQDVYIGVDFIQTIVNADESQQELKTFLSSFCVRVSQKNQGSIYQPNRMIITATLASADGIMR